MSGALWKVAFGAKISEWSRSYSQKKPESFPLECVTKSSFMASFTKDQRQPTMKEIITWKYGRTWHKEHKEYIESKPKEMKQKFIKPDIYFRRKGHFAKYFVIKKDKK